MPGLDQRRSQLLQHGGADVRIDLLFGKLPVTLSGLPDKPSADPNHPRGYSATVILDGSTAVPFSTSASNWISSACTAFFVPPSVTHRARRLPVTGSGSAASNFSRQLFLPRRVMLLIICILTID
jgi:hypothetical protein